MDPHRAGIYGGFWAGAIIGPFFFANIILQAWFTIVLVHPV